MTELETRLIRTAAVLDVLTYVREVTRVSNLGASLEDTLIDRELWEIQKASKQHWRKQEER